MTDDRIAQIEARLSAWEEARREEDWPAMMPDAPVKEHAPADLRYLLDRLRAVEADLAQARATNARLNRRAQQAESAAAQTVEDCRRQGVSLGRGLALWAAERAEATLERVRAVADQHQDDPEGLCTCGAYECDRYEDLREALDQEDR